MRTLEILAVRLVAAILRRRRSEFGRYRLTKTFLPLLRKHGRELGSVIVTTRHGFKLRTHLNDWLGQYVFLTGTYEPDTARLFETLVHPGSTVLDVGANIGFFSLLSASLARNGGRVLAFEPAPRARSRLEENIALNNLRTVEVHSFCASNTAGSVTLYEGPEEHTGISSMRPLGGETAAIEVAARAIDDLLPSLTAVRLVKIDVEGAELLALEGMRQLVDRDRPFLIIEVTDSYLRAFGHDARQLLEWLTAKSYQTYKIGDRGLSRVAGMSADAGTQFNALCVPTDRRNELPIDLFAST